MAEDDRSSGRVLSNIFGCSLRSRSHATVGMLHGAKALPRRWWEGLTGLPDTVWSFRMTTNWFEELFGFNERSYDETKKNLEVVGATLRSRINQRSLRNSAERLVGRSER